ncbi:uncharacterized protein E5676_scaffold549G00150 [Cucumis melo var. makuwa]|uniref:Uncharacterized protein n=1 Tax=Cucumis melo var. makuwa TaxID=1194695 RepID=A0A5D3BC13_CUCMM|nr:uncharacterized protein E5676_scaffold549G00150 [Cucumis melo var. makuwa]
MKLLNLWNWLSVMSMMWGKLGVHVYHREATNLARFEWSAISSEGGRLSREYNVDDEDDDILDLLTDLQGSMIAREENFDDGDGFDDEFLQDVDEMDTSNIF